MRQYEAFNDTAGLWDFNLNPADASTAVDSGQLIVEPANNTFWFNSSSSFGLYKANDGDFMATSFVRTRSLTRPAQPPLQQINLAGLMARNRNNNGPARRRM